MAKGTAARKPGINVFAAPRPGASRSPSRQSALAPNTHGLSHLVRRAAWSPATDASKSATAASQQVYLFPSASEPLRQGFVRVINHAAEAGEVTIDPVDDSGREFDTITLSIGAHQTVHFNSRDLENGNSGKGLSGNTGSGQGDWRLAFSSTLDIEVLSYIRTTDGFLTAMHDVAPQQGDIHRVAIFNPGSNRSQVSRLRLVNPTDGTAEVTIRGTDDKGLPGTGQVSLTLEPGTATEITAQALESGASGFEGTLGNGSGKWRLALESEQSIVAMSLLESPTDHVANLSSVPLEPEDGTHVVPLFPRAGDESGRQGFVRVINRADAAGRIRIKAYDQSERDYEAVTLAIGANMAVHFNSDDLEQGSSGKGLSGGVGAGEGDWRLEMTSDLDIEVLSYIRTEDGFLTSMHDVVPSAGTRHRLAVFNPGSNRNQESLLRLVNPGEGSAEVTIAGVDDRGAPGDGEVTLSVPGGGARTVRARELEAGGKGLAGMLGDGAGKWQLTITSDVQLLVMSLLQSPTGHLTNLSTAPLRGADGGAIGRPVPQSAEEVFGTLISGPIVQSKCINCHVQGGASGHTRLVFLDNSDPDHEAANLQVFVDFLAEVDDGAAYILNKIQGALGHGGGIQVAAGTEHYANMERFLTLLGEDVSPVGITPETLFDGVTMESPRRTFRRAAITLAGRVPTDSEYESIRTGGVTALRAAIRGLMEGPGFHAFLIRASNDRLLTDRNLHNVIDPASTDDFVDLTNLYHEKASSGDLDGLSAWENRVQYGLGRAPIELIAYVARNDLPFTEVLTADYIMANPEAAEAYGATTRFDDPNNVHEFQPSAIRSYYRDDESKVAEYTLATGTHVTSPGNLKTDYSHAGILNTTVFLLRYPTTATNRNRARSRWTYYHFLGLDIEKSASRTTDPVALSDTQNPTMHNPACTVCHQVLDPVAGAFQNYGDEGFYRDQWGGLDALDDFYKNDPPGGADVNVEALSWEEKESVSVVGKLAAGHNTIGLQVILSDDQQRSTGWTPHVGIDRIAIRDSGGSLVQQYELEDVFAGRDDWPSNGEYCGQTLSSGRSDGQKDSYRLWECPLAVPVEVSETGDYTVEVITWVLAYGGYEPNANATLRIWAPASFYESGDTWYRDMREPGFGGELAPSPETSLQWLAKEIVSDSRFAEATVKFWWPAIMGSEIAEPPEDQSDAGFEGLLLASNAQAAEVERLAQGFQRGFRAGNSYNLKDLLVEIVLSRWFRAQRISDNDPVRTLGLTNAGGKRLLTPEELSRKTAALTGFQWGRFRNQDWRSIHEQDWNSLTDTQYGYGLLYGGIDSDGLIERARDLTSVMAGAAQSHALESSCPIVMRELYLLPDEDRRLFDGVDNTVTPRTEFAADFEIEAESRAEIQTLSLRGDLRAGSVTVALTHRNPFFEESGHGHRGILLDQLIVRRGNAEILRYEMQNLNHPVDCHHLEQGTFHLATSGTDCILRVPVDIPSDGAHEIEILAWADRAGDELAKLEVSVESNTELSAGSLAIKAKLVDLYRKLHGLTVAPDSLEVADAYGLFVDVWRRRLDSENGDFYGWNEGIACDWPTDQRYLDGIVEAPWVWRDDWGDERGARYDWDWDRIDTHFEQLDWSDNQGIAETWTVLLAYLLMDYRYLYL